MSFKEYLQHCMDQGFGNPLGEPWSAETLGPHANLSPKIIGEWLGDSPPKPRASSIGKLALAFGFSRKSRWEKGRESQVEILDKERHQALVTAARSPARGVRGDASADERDANGQSGPSGLSSANPRAWTFPEELSAPLAARRAELREEISALLEADAGPSAQRDNGLALLAQHWREAGLPDPQPGQESSEPVQLFQSFTRAIRKCNDLPGPWGGKAPQAGALRRTACMRIAKLLSAMAWTEAAWPALPLIGAAQRLHSVVHPRLLLAGIEAARGVDFELPVDTQRPGAARKSFDFLSLATWHVAMNGEIRGGVGKDNESRLLLLLDRAINAHNPAPDPQADPLAIARLKRKLGSQIAIWTGQFGRSVMVSEEFVDDDDPGIAQLFTFANSLAALALAHSSAAESPYIRGSEDMVMAAIDLCLQVIAEIPD